MSQTTRYLNSIGQGEVEIATLVNYLVVDAVQAGASDIHIEPWESTLVVRIRLHGVLTELVHLPRDLMDKVAGRIKVLGNLVTYRNDLPQEGHAPANPELGGAELRISVFPTVRGEKIVIRLFDTTNRSFDLGSLGLDLNNLRTLINLISRPNGLVLFTGPTGSGKTTTMYSALCHIVSRAGSTMSISTVEDPVEFHLPMISQAQVNPAREFTYPIALRSLMRQDPQVIMVGEIRDPETASIAVQAGLTGHLVISSVHAGSTAGVFARMINMNVEPFLLASSVSGVLGLRLIRRNCPICAEPYEPDPAVRKLVPQQFGTDIVFRRGSGCPACNQTGFAGRTALCEVLVVDDAVRSAILEKMPTSRLQEIAQSRGMMTLWDSAMRRVLDGETSIEEILRVLPVGEG
ncbi:MAG: type II/IV secretion system protein [Verrucomicrobiales bacterium]|nr:type II/IV secretion system protein [Verrucomicrobiales bacterium]